MSKITSGFTLIEILVVIVIISIVSSVATLTIHFNRNKQLETLAHQLRNAINLAEEEALLRPAILGMAFTKQHWQFYQYQEKTHQWLALSNKTLRSTSIPEYAQISVKIQGKLIPLDGKPRLIISSNGDIPAFIIALSKQNEDPLYEVIGEEGGNVYAK